MEHHPLPLVRHGRRGGGEVLHVRLPQLEDRQDHALRLGGPRAEGTVMTVEFELDGQPFVALNGGRQFTFSEAISFQVFCETQEESTVLGQPRPRAARRARAAGSRTASACPGRSSRGRFRGSSTIPTPRRRSASWPRCQDRQDRGRRARARCGENTRLRAVKAPQTLKARLSRHFERRERRDSNPRPPA